MKELVIIGATGKLAVPIINRLVSKPIKLTALVRDVEKAKTVLPSGIDIKYGDLQDIDSLTKGLAGVGHIYLNLSSNGVPNEFQPEIDGIKNLVKAVDHESIKQVIQISGVGALRPDFHTNGTMLYTNAIRNEGFMILRHAGIPHTRMHASWFADAIPWFVSHNKFIIYGNQPNRIYWTNTVDFADQLFNAIGNEALSNSDLVIQGEYAYTMKQAAELFGENTDNALHINHQTITQELGNFGKLMEYFDQFQEQLIAESTWSLVGKPTMSFADFVKKYLN